MPVLSNLGHPFALIFTLPGSPPIEFVRGFPMFLPDRPLTVFVFQRHPPDHWFLTCLFACDLPAFFLRGTAKALFSSHLCRPNLFASFSALLSQRLPPWLSTIAVVGFRFPRVGICFFFSAPTTCFFFSVARTASPPLSGRHELDHLMDRIMPVIRRNQLEFPFSYHDPVPLFAESVNVSSISSFFPV